MIEEIKKEVKANLEKLTKQTVKLVSFVISCWLVIGTVVIGVAAPVQVASSIMKIDWNKESTARDVDVDDWARGEIAPRGRRVYPYQDTQTYGYAPVRRQYPQSSLRSDLRQTRGVMSEVRDLTRAFTNR